MTARVGVALLPEHDPASDRRWAHVEALGFAHAWCFDHLAWRTLADSPWHATVPVLAAAAMTTSTIGLGTFVATPNYRHPVPFAKDLMTLDVMSQGRLLVGVGAGAPGFDAAVLGDPALPPGRRQDRFEEFVDLLGELLGGPRTTWAGAYYRAVDARMIPGPVQRPRPPLVVAGNGPRGMRLALRHGDGWATMGTAPHGSERDVWWAGVADAARRFTDLAQGAGGEPTNFRRYLDLMALAGPAASADQLHDDAARAGELGFTDVVIPWPRPGDPYRGDEAVLDELAARLVDGAVTA